MHEGVKQWVVSCLVQLPPPRRVAEFGSRDINGSVREQFTKADVYVGIDLRPGPSVDVVADACVWSPADGYPFDIILCLETLEHAPQADMLCTNAQNMLRRGGALIVTAAGVGFPPHSAADGRGLAETEWTSDVSQIGPTREFYRTVSNTRLTAWLAGFTSADVHVTGTMIYALAIR